MVPSKAIFTRLMTIWAAYIDTQIAAPGWLKQAVSQPFNPSPNLVAADVTIDHDWGNDAIAVVGGVISGTDPINQAEMVGSPADTALDSSTSATARNVYGWVLTVSGTGVVLAGELLPGPIAINKSLQFVGVPILRFRMPENAVR